MTSGKDGHDAFEVPRGGCLCGDVRYELGGEPLRTSICYCTTCRRASGAPCVAWAIVSRSDFVLSRGDLVRFPSSEGRKRGHCRRCGTTLTFEDSLETIDVTLASLDEPERFAPERQIWLEQKLAWAPASSRIASFMRTGGGDPP